MSGQKAEKERSDQQKKAHKSYRRQEVEAAITFRAEELSDDLCFH